ncbi:MAG: hypothetical protein IJW17_00760 [Lentisphaeria bacterium]|nr:hypothetical protein [Lentisphaeria bacterium]
MQLIRCVLLDDTVKDISIAEPEESLIIRKNSIPDNTKYLDVMPEYLTANVGDEGFMLIPSIEGSHYSAQTMFRQREKCEEVFPENSMPVYACRRGDHTILAIVTGMKFDYSLVIGVRDGRYYLYPRFILDGAEAYEDIEIRFLHLRGDVRYPDVARLYRKFQLDNGNCRTLRDKAAERPALKEYADTIECRIRLAWKPVPSTVDDQIIGVNEPEVHAELTFKDVDDIISEFHKQGIDKVNFCLVGWNAGGHDGRFPDLFPVEPKCGTLEELKELVARTRNLGYMISAHTNLIEGYSVGGRFKHDYVLRRKDGSDHRGGNWGGGKSYLLCPEMACRYYIDQDMADLKDLGFYGEHYFDVFSIYPPYPCYHPEHKLNRKEVAQWRCRMLKKAQEAIGCSGSEGSWDFAMDALDYVLYAAFFFKEPTEHPMCDEYIPFWNIVYHGIVLYNCFAASVNANIKNDYVLKVMNYAWGGRPLNYVNSRFIVGENPWGNEDLRYFPQEQFRKDVAAIRKDYDFYQSIKDLQYEFIEDYEILSNGALKTTYSDGTIMLSNPTDKDIEIDGKKIASFNNLIVK